MIFFVGKNAFHFRIFLFRTEFYVGHEIFRIILICSSVYSGLFISLTEGEGASSVIMTSLEKLNNDGHSSK